MDYSKQIVYNFASRELVSNMLCDGEKKFLPDDVLLIYATFITRLSFDKISADEKNTLIKNVEYFLSSKGRLRKVLSLTKVATTEFLNDFWLSSLSSDIKNILIEDIKLVSSVDSDGYVVINDKLFGAYKSQLSKEQKPILFGTRTGNFDDSYATWEEFGFDYPDELKGHHLWSWKCIDNDEMSSYPDELKCVGQNEWVDKSISEFKSLKELATYRGEQSAKLGSVTRTWWDFCMTMKIGDLVVLLNSTSNEIIGLAKIVGDYIYDFSHPNYRHRRKIEWICKDHAECLFNIGSGNTWPMPICNPDRLHDLLPYINHVFRA